MACFSYINIYNYLTDRAAHSSSVTTLSQSHTLHRYAILSANETEIPFRYCMLMMCYSSRFVHYDLDERVDVFPPPLVLYLSISLFLSVHFPFPFPLRICLCARRWLVFMKKKKESIYSIFSHTWMRLAIICASMHRGQNKRLSNVAPLADVSVVEKPGQMHFDWIMEMATGHHHYMYVHFTQDTVPCYEGLGEIPSHDMKYASKYAQWIQYNRYSVWNFVRDLAFDLLF